MLIISLVRFVLALLLSIYQGQTGKRKLLKYSEYSYIFVKKGLTEQNWFVLSVHPMLSFESRSLKYEMFSLSYFLDVLHPFNSWGVLSLNNKTDAKRNCIEHQQRATTVLYTEVASDLHGTKLVSKVFLAVIW